MSNPGLKAERATQIELGAMHRLGFLNAQAAVWYARVNDAIMAFPFIYQGTATSQSRNVGNGDYYGAEVSLTAEISPAITLGGNYSWVQRDLADPSIPAFHPTGTPSHKGFAYARWRPLSTISITPNIDIASNRWVSTPAGSYYRSGHYVLTNFRVDYTIHNNADIGLSGRNLFDVAYSTADGYPEAGRSLLLTLRLRY